MFPTKIVEEIKKTFCVQQLSFESRTVCETMWENTAERDRPQMTIWPMRNACWISSATNTQLEYVILTALPLLQR